MKRLTKLLIILDLFVISFLIVIYAPQFEKVQKKIVNNIKENKKLSYLSYTLYNQDIIDSLIDEEEIIETRDYSEYYTTVKNNNKMTYDNIYDQLILTKDPGNDDYKVIKTNIGKNQAYIVAIYDPSKVHILTSKKFASSDHYSGLETIKQMTKRLGASVGINGGGFKQDARTMSIDTPTGYVIKDGKIVWNRTGGGKGRIIGIDNDNRLRLINATGKEALEMGIRDALEFGPFLIVDGVTQKLPIMAGGYMRSARSVIAQRRDGIILFLVTEVKNGYTNGTTLQEIVDLLEKYDVYNAANLDGGASSQLVVDGKVLNRPLNIYNRVINGGNGRSLVTGWGLINK